MAERSLKAARRMLRKTIERYLPTEGNLSFGFYVRLLGLNKSPSHGGLKIGSTF